jgi:GNAT superfamily N-acetyltransferase
MSNVTIKIALKKDLEEILNLQKEAYISEAKIYNDYSIPPLHQTIDEIAAEFDEQLFLKAEIEGEIAGSARGYSNDDICYIGRLIVRPAYQNMGIGSRLLKGIEAQFAEVKRYELFTGAQSEKNLHIYTKNGYKKSGQKRISEALELIYLSKDNI